MHRLTKAGRVIITSSFSIAKGLHSRVSSYNLILKGSTTFECWALVRVARSFLTQGGNDCKVLNDTLRVDSFTGTRFA